MKPAIKTQPTVIEGNANNIAFNAPQLPSPLGAAFGQIFDAYFGQLYENIVAAFKSELIQQQVKSGPSAPDGEKLLSVDETAQLLGICRQTVHDWKRRGLLDFHRLGGKVYFKQAEVVAALNKQVRPDGKRKGARKAS